MKKNIIALGLIVAATFALTDCTKEIENPAEMQDSAGVPFELIASTAETKTAAGDDLSTVWVNNDALSVFHTEAGSTEYGVNDKFSITTENLSSGRFTGTLSAALEAGKSYDWYAFYPYKEAYKTPATTNSGVVYVGSKYNEVQTQAGYGSMKHLSGVNFPLYGKVKGLDASKTPSIPMSHLVSVIELTVTNTTSEPLSVSSIAFEAPESIIGGYYISIAGDEVVYHPNGQYVNAVATLEVEGGTVLAKDESAKFYIGFKPFVAKSGDVLAMSVNGYEKEVTLDKDVTFAPGKIKPLNFNFDKIQVQSLPYSEAFNGTQGKFTVNNVTLDEGLSYVWSTNKDYIKASAFVSGKNYGSESWLISPYIDLSDASKAFMSFEHLGNFFTDVAAMETETFVKVRKHGGEWTDVEIAYPSELSWNFVHSGYVPLTSFVGGNAQVAFVYKSTSSKAGTWEIKNFKVDLKKDQLLSFSTDNVSSTLGQSFTAPELDGAETTVTYSSSNTGVAVVANDGTVTLVAAGETVITATASATDEYNEASASYTLKVTAPLTGNEKYYIKVTEAPADWTGKYLLVCDTKGVAFSAFSTTSTIYGIGADVDVTTIDGQDKILSDATTDACQVVIAAATVTEEAYVIKFGNKYFNWSSGNSLKGVDAESVNANWKLSVNSGNTVIVNVNDETRKLQWNAGSPRFACYTSTQTAVQLYRLEN